MTSTNPFLQFHAISYCLSSGDSECLKEKYSVLRNDSIYRADTFQVGRRQEAGSMRQGAGG